MILLLAAAAWFGWRGYGRGTLYSVIAIMAILDFASYAAHTLRDFYSYDWGIATGVAIFWLAAIAGVYFAGNTFRQRRATIATSSPSDRDAGSRSPN